MPNKPSDNNSSQSEQTTVSQRPKGKPLSIGKLTFEHWQVISLLLGIYDVIAVIFAYFIALWLRFDAVYSQIPQRYYMAYARIIIPVALVSLVIFYLFRMYNSMWRYASFAELERTLLASAISSTLHSIAITVIFTRMPIAYYLLGGMLQFLMLIGVRFAYRFLRGTTQIQLSIRPL